MRERDPYGARHSSMSWNLMMGKNFLWVAEQHGHSPEVMLKTYAKWMRGTTEKDFDATRCAAPADLSLICHWRRGPERLSL